MRDLVRRLLPIIDLLLVPLVYPAAMLLKLLRRAGIQRFPASRRALLQVGVFPIRNHYYEPQFDHRHPRQSFHSERILPGIDWNVAGQLQLLERMFFADEIADLRTARQHPLDFRLDNGAFESGDAEYWYQFIRALKPARIFEIGSGHSTLLAIRALGKNAEENPGYRCRHVCIEPYEAPWLGQASVELVRRRVEEIGTSFFAALQSNDILFIDSSHVIRPQGDVVFACLELLPTLAPGVMVHIHDIFSPRNYPAQWLADEVKLWNEQYLVEALLSDSRKWKVVGALNYLHHHHHDRLKAVAPFLTPEREPGSLYIQSS